LARRFGVPLTSFAEHRRVAAANGEKSVDKNEF